MAYVFLKAFAETRNLRHWEAKSDQLTRSDKNHSQTQVTQSHFLTLSDVWHKMAYDFLKAFVKTRNLRRWKAKSERESYWIGFALSGYVVTSKVHSGPPRRAAGPETGPPPAPWSDRHSTQNSQFPKGRVLRYRGVRRRYFSFRSWKCLYIYLPITFFFYPKGTLTVYTPMANPVSSMDFLQRKAEELRKITQKNTQKSKKVDKGGGSGDVDNN